MARMTDEEAEALDKYYTENTFEMKQPRYNVETEAAMHEARDIMSGKKKAKSYSSADELFEELDAEYEAEK